jgi:hypothetical protein
MPITLICAHTLECALKAFLSRGGDDARLKNPKLRHNLEELWRLAAAEGAFHGGKCTGVAYRVQSLSPAERAWKRFATVNRRLTGHEGRWDGRTRPHGMHLRTFRRLSVEWYERWGDLLHNALAEDDRRATVLPDWQGLPLARLSGRSGQDDGTLM